MYEHFVQRPPRHPADVWTLNRPIPDDGWTRRGGPFFAERARRKTVWAFPAGEDSGAPVIGSSGGGDELRPLLIKQVDEFAAGIPIAIPTLLCAVLPARLLLACRRHVRLVRERRCPGCGYDVRTTPDRCPECGRERRA